jgi:GNAT superfamily N-acetyltransferase
VTAAELRHLPGLQEVAFRADKRFIGLGLFNAGSSHDPGLPFSVLHEAQQAGLLFVALAPDGRAVGLATCRIDAAPGPFGLEVCLDQLSVEPEHGRIGLGGALLAAVYERARDHPSQLSGVWLSTFRKIAWNGPFYRRHGFFEVPRQKLSDYQLNVEDWQRASMDVSLRCFMRRPIKRRFSLRLPIR